MVHSLTEAEKVCCLTNNCTFARQIKLSCALSLSPGLQSHNHRVHAYMGLVMNTLRSQKTVRGENQQGSETVSGARLGSTHLRLQWSHFE